MMGPIGDIRSIGVVGINFFTREPILHRSHPTTFTLLIDDALLAGKIFTSNFVFINRAN